jgi:nucleoid-associated protein YgaU/DNA-binding SARP family transcriptional activator
MRSRQILRGVASLTAAIVLLLGVPLLLARLVGWPLPTSMPSANAFQQATQSGLSDDVVINVLAVVIWVTWAQLVLAVAVETIAVFHGRQVGRIPVLPGLQITAARLVAGVLMVTSTLQPIRAQAAPLPNPIVAHVTASTLSAADQHRLEFASAGVQQVAGPDTRASTPETVTVQRHDSYWAIAERTLGDGLRWKEILDLNVERTLQDGTTISADGTLHSGWVLHLPTDASVGTEPKWSGEAVPPADQPEPAAPEVDGSTTAVVEPGDNLWSISEDHLESELAREAADSEVAPYWSTVIDANQDRFVQAGNPSLIRPGQVLVLPATGHEPPSAPSTLEAAPVPAPVDTAEAAPILTPAPSSIPDVEAPVPPSPPAPLPESSATESRSDEASPTSAPEATRSNESTSGASSGTPVPLAVAIGGLSSVALAVGLKRLLRRRRRRFSNEHPGQMSAPTPAEQRGVHQAIIAQADEQRIDDLNGVLGALAASLAAAGSERRPRIVRHSSTSIEVLVDRPDPNAPDGWTATGDGSVWTLSEHTNLHSITGDGPINPSPLLVTIGEPDDDAQTYLDLEADGTVALTGDPHVASNLARSIATELTLSPLADTVRVIAIGDVVEPDARVFEHLSIVDSWDGHIDDLLAWSAQSHAALVENGWANAFIGRACDPDHDALAPIVVVADRLPPEEIASSLRAAQPSTVAVVVIGEFADAMTTIRCEPDALHFDEIGLACSPQEMDVEELAALTSVLVATDSPAEMDLLEHLKADFSSVTTSNGSERVDDPAQLELATDTADPSDYDVLVRLLGDIAVEGGDPLKPKATAVVAYLALHRSVTTARLDDACWFGSDGVSHTKRIHDTMAECRAALGSQHFPANRGGRYVAGSRVRTDLELFDWHAQACADLPADQAIQRYRAALDLVTGRPFSYPNAARASYGWVDFEHHATAWELRIAGVAQACAALCLDQGDAGTAIAVLRGVVQSLPLDSALTEALMRAHVADGDRAGAERVYREHATALAQADLGDPDDSIEQVRLDAHAS